MRLVLPLLLLVGCSGEASAPTAPPAEAAAPPAPSAAPTTPATPEAPEAPAAAPAPIVSSNAFLSATPSLRAEPNDAERALLTEGRHAPPQVLAGARIESPEGVLGYFVYEWAESLERWASAREDGTYEAARAEVARRMAECETEREDCFDCRSCAEDLDDEAVPTGVHVDVARVFTPTGGAPRLDGTTNVAAQHAQVTVRRLEDTDLDGRLELDLAIETVDYDSGQSGAGGTIFVWLDGDSLALQLTIQHRAWTYGCMAGLRERSGFSVRDRNGDGRPDFGVRHAIWVDGCEGADDWPAPTGTVVPTAEMARSVVTDALGESSRLVGSELVDEEDPRWDEASPLDCAYFDERLRYFYDAATDTWREAGADAE